MLKPIEINFKLDKTIKRAHSTDMLIKSHDINVIEFHISFDGLELTADHAVKVLSVFSDTKSQTNVNCDVIDGKAIYRPDASIISQYEHVLNYVYVYHGDQSLDVREFTYSVDLSKIDETALKVKEVYDQSYSDLLADFELALENYKDSLPQASDLRAEVDVILNKFKVDSVAKLSQFDADAQQAIAYNQTAFGVAESGRQSTYEQAEDSRNQASNQAVADWNMTADALLETVEGNESARVDAEATRKSNETTRISNENARKSAEDTRQANELLREENYNQKVDTAIVEADVVIKVDNKVTELAPQISNLTAQLAQTQSQFNQAVGAITEDSEVVLARNEYPTLKERLDAEWDNVNADKVQNFKIKNELVNGDFSQGKLNWEASGGAFNIVNSIAEFTPSAMYQELRYALPATANKQYYIFARIKTSSQTTGIKLSYTNINGVAFPIIASTINSIDWQNLSGVTKVDTVIGTNFLVVKDFRTTGFDKIFIDNVMLIDLTATFGAGNEPTKLEMDELMKVIPNQWWDGEMSLTQKQYVIWKLNLWRKTTNAVIALGGTII